MKLVFDIGNSAIKGALFDNSEAVVTFVIDVDAQDPERGFNMKLLSLDFEKTIDSIGCVSVVPALTERLSATIESVYNRSLTVLTTRSPVPIGNEYETIDTLGADRLAAAVAAWSMFARRDSDESKAVLVVDAGTSTTIEVVSADGSYLGGSIGVGPALMRASLSQGTAQLPLVDLELPESPIGRSTDEAMRAGLLYGYLGAVEGLIGRIQRSLPARAVVVATGGWSRWLSERIPEIDFVEPQLVLHGVRLMMEYAEDRGREEKT